MGWDAGLHRKLAVPVAVGGLGRPTGKKAFRTRMLKGLEQDPDDLVIARKLAKNRARLERLLEEIESEPMMDGLVGSEDELDYIEATVQLGLLEITAELEDLPSSEELLEEEDFMRVPELAMATQDALSETY